MYTNCNFKPVKLIVLLTFSIMFGVASNGLAGGPQPGQEGLVFEGKAVDGILNAVVVDPAAVFHPEISPDAMPYVVQYIIVSCKNAQVLFGPDINFPSSSPANLAQTTAECPGENPDEELCLEGWVFEGAAVDLPQPECFPEAQAGILDDIIITRVKNFINTGTAISAEVTLRLGQQ